MYSILLAGVGLAAHASAACTRAQLQEATATYLKAQAAGKPDMLALAANASYAENDMAMDIKKGVLSQALPIDHNLTFHDAVECAAFAEITSATAKHPYVIHTQMLFTDGKISRIQSVVTDDGDWAFNATGHLYWGEKETWGPVPEAQRNTRAVIKAAGDAYLDQWGNASLPVPEGTPCARLEGGGYSGDKNASANTCHMGAFPQPLKVGNRRYVIDEEMGAMDIFNDFPWLEASLTNGSTPSSNLFKIDNGKIRYIHEVTVCITSHCGRVAPPPPNTTTTATV